MGTPGLLSSVTVTAVGVTCKAFINLGFCSMTVNGLSVLLDALHSTERKNGRGIITGTHFVDSTDYSFSTYL